MSEIATISRSEIDKSSHLMLTNDQINIILSKTPKKYVKSRPGKGGGRWNYVDVSYVTKCLNLMFGWDWDFEIEDQIIGNKQVIVKGRLVCRVGDREITKMQYGRKDIVMWKDSTEPIDVGNDLKAAASDALKKCASMIGIAADVYGADDFKEVQVAEVTLNQLKDLYEQKSAKLSEEEKAHAQRIISQKEEKSYYKLYQLLTNKND